MENGLWVREQGTLLTVKKGGEEPEARKKPPGSMETTILQGGGE